MKMFLFRIICSSRRSVNRHLTIHCGNQIYKSRFKKFYCYCIRELKTNVKLEKFYEINSYNYKGINNFEQQHEQYSERTRNTFFEDSINSDTQSLHQNSMSYLTNIYDIVKHEFHEKCISVKCTPTKDQMVHCVIDVTWPYKMSFSSKANNGKKARQSAALMCLNWLHSNNKIKELKPILYSNEDIETFFETQKSVAIDLELELKDNIKLIVDTYEEKIKSIVTMQPTTTDFNKNDLKGKEEQQLLPKMNTESAHHNMINPLLKLNQTFQKNIHLPIFEYKEEILNSLQNNQVLLIKGGTGCGKSTQVPQFIIDAYTEQCKTNECNIIVTEPRKISAISLAHRVALERNENVGDVVGYQVRFNGIIPNTNGSIMFYTTGILLQKLKYDPTLEGISHVIIDEAHERSLEIDLLLKLFKDLLKLKPFMKLIVMSATVNANLFQHYFSAAVVHVPGNLYPTKMHFMEDIDIFKDELHLCKEEKPKIAFDKIVELVKWIITNKPPGGILCFLPGWVEIKYLNDLLKNSGLSDLLIFVLHSKIPNDVQQEIFEPVPENVTKIVLATDIAESGVTIPDISYVIDTAIKKEQTWDEHSLAHIFDFTWVSQANVLQRKGRAGRVKRGESYHLITKKMYNKLDRYPMPHILKTSLEKAAIIIKTNSNEKISDFFNNMIVPPHVTSVTQAIQTLSKLGILDSNENLTGLGKRISHFSLDIRLSKALILACVFQCLKPILLLSVSTSFGEHLFVPTPSINEKYQSIKAEKLKFHKTSDHIAALRYYEHWLNCSFIDFDINLANIDSFEVFHKMKKLYNLHMFEVTNSGILQSLSNAKSANTNSEENELVRGILFAATNQLIKKLDGAHKDGYFTKNKHTLIIEDQQRVQISNKSVNFKRKIWPSSILTYIFKMEFTTRNNIIEISDTSIISPLSVLLFSQNDVQCNKDPEKFSSNGGKICIVINNIENVQFCCDEETADLLMKFRNILWNVVNYIIEREGEDTCEDDLKLVRSYKNDLTLLLLSMLRSSSKGIDVETFDQ